MGKINCERSTARVEVGVDEFEVSLRNSKLPRASRRRRRPADASPESSAASPVPFMFTSFDLKSKKRTVRTTLSKTQIIEIWYLLT